MKIHTQTLSQPKSGSKTYEKANQRFIFYVLACLKLIELHETSGVFTPCSQQALLHSDSLKFITPI